MLELSIRFSPGVSKFAEVDLHPKTVPNEQPFDYFLSNPPFGVDWKKQQKEIEAEHKKRRFVINTLWAWLGAMRVRAATERTIELLKERRAALLAAAVAGQIDVGAGA